MKRLKVQKGLILIVAVAALLALTARAHAVPTLQIFIPGASYDEATETWVIQSYDYELWVVGEVETHGPIYDVKISLAVPEGEDGSITITWLEPGEADYGGGGVSALTLTEAGGMGYDAYRASYAGGPPAPSTYGFASNSTPLMGDGSELPPHGVFPSDFYEYYVGDFTTTEDTVYDYTPGPGYDGGPVYPSDFTGDGKGGDIKRFRVQVEGYSWMDIVAYDHYVQSNEKAHYVFSPFSHDGGGGAPVPEPGTIALFGMGLLTLGGILRKRG